MPSRRVGHHGVVTAPPPHGPVTVDVWIRRVTEVPEGRDLLDDHERTTLEGIVPPSAARSYAAGHVLARRAVASVVGSRASDLRFDRTCTTCGEPHGRPVLPEFPMLHLSLSHGETLVAVAVSSALVVGVDAETARATDFPGFPLVALHEDERAAVEGAPAGRLLRRAIAWVRKEAALKALGIGLRSDPSNLLTPPSGSATDLAGDGHWVTVQDVPLPWPDAAAAVAVSGRAERVDVRYR